MKRRDLPLVTLDGRHAGELLAHPCDCGHPYCTIGEHVWRSTADMTPGPKAQAYEPRVAGSSAPTDDDPPADPTATLHAEYRHILTAYQRASWDLRRFIDAYRPDRYIPLPQPASDDDWCRNHLTLLGTCEPRYRGDLCRWCYDIGLAHGTAPDVILMRQRHEARRITEPDIADFIARTRVVRPRKGKRKRAG